MQPAEYRADLVIELLDNEPVGAVVLEVQRSPDERKRLIARRDPELAVLSAMAHGRDQNAGRAAAIAAAALGASVPLDPDRSRLYCDATRRELQAMDPAKYEFQSEFAKRYIALGKEEGKAEGKAEGRADLGKRQLALRYGALTPQATARLSAASIDELDAIGERLLTAATLDEALGAK